MVTTSVKPAAITDTFSLSRILLEKGKTFSTASDTLYFCGTLSYGASNSDFIYGYISSGDVNSY